MKFSLILCTLGRKDEPRRFLNSLIRQNYTDIELIIVDQNRDDKIDLLLKEMRLSFNVVHLKNEPGLSKARNVGLKHITGDIVAFPDDDCWYSEGLLGKLKTLFAENSSIDGFLGRAVDENNIPSAGCHDKHSSAVTRLNIMRRSVSHCIFLRSKFVRAVGDFDELLGVGAGTPWGASEEADYLIRGLDQGFNLFFDPDIKIFHPQTFPKLDEKYFDKAYKYGSGFGRVLKKHNFPLSFVGWAFFRTFGGICLTLAAFKFASAKYHTLTFLGRLRGYRSLPEKLPPPPD